jgi:hypothetical protein
MMYAPRSNKVLHADSARLGKATLVLAFGDRRLGAGAAGEHQGVGRMPVLLSGGLE